MSALYDQSAVIMNATLRNGMVRLLDIRRRCPIPRRVLVRSWIRQVQSGSSKPEIRLVQLRVVWRVWCVRCLACGVWKVKCVIKTRVV